MLIRLYRPTDCAAMAALFLTNFVMEKPNR